MPHFTCKHRSATIHDSCLYPADDDEDPDVLDPAHLATVHADQQVMQISECQQPQPQHQSLHLQVQRQQQLQCQDESVRSQLLPDRPETEHVQASLQQPDLVQPATQAISADLVQGYPQGNQERQEEEEDEELICMDDPRFVNLSERKQKLMALEEILLNTGIEG